VSACRVCRMLCLAASCFRHCCTTWNLCCTGNLAARSAAAIGYRYYRTESRERRCYISLLATAAASVRRRVSARRSRHRLSILSDREPRAALLYIASRRGRGVSTAARERAAGHFIYSSASAHPHSTSMSEWARESRAHSIDGREMIAERKSREQLGRGSRSRPEQEQQLGFELGKSKSKRRRGGAGAGAGAPASAAGCRCAQRAKRTRHTAAGARAQQRTRAPHVTRAQRAAAHAHATRHSAQHASHEPTRPTSSKQRKPTSSTLPSTWTPVSKSSGSVLPDERGEAQRHQPGPPAQEQQPGSAARGGSWPGG
jgi:hypothetical protein